MGSSVVLNVKGKGWSYGIENVFGLYLHLIYLLLWLQRQNVTKKHWLAGRFSFFCRKLVKIRSLYHHSKDAWTTSYFITYYLYKNWGVFFCSGHYFFAFSLKMGTNWRINLLNTLVLLSYNLHFSNSNLNMIQVCACAQWSDLWHRDLWCYVFV